MEHHRNRETQWDKLFAFASIQIWQNSMISIPSIDILIKSTERAINVTRRGGHKTKRQDPALSKEKNTESCKLPFSVTENGSQAHDYG